MPEERGLYPKMPVEEQLTYLAQLHGMPESRSCEAAAHWVKRLGVAAERASDSVESLSAGKPAARPARRRAGA